MKSTLKTVVVYDLETGGLSSKYNSITEIAMVAVSLQDLTIVDKMSVMIRPRINLSNMEKEVS